MGDCTTRAGDFGDPQRERVPRTEHAGDVDDDALVGVLTWLVDELGGDGVLVSDAAGYIVLADARAEALLGYAAGGLEGEPVDAVLSDLSLAAGAARTSGGSAGSSPLTVGALMARGARRVGAHHADGRVLDVEVSGKPVATRRGQFTVLTIRAVPDAGPIVRDRAASTARQLRARVLVIGTPDVRPDSALAVLDANGFEILAAEEAAAAISLIETDRPDAVVLDSDGAAAEVFELLHAVKAAANVPVLVVSGHAEEDELVGALQLGADDYITKPFSAAELVERVRVVLRRSPSPGPRAMQFGDVDIDLDARVVTVAGRDAQLSPIEFDLLVFLARTPRHVFSRSELLRYVWGSRADWQTEATVTEHVRRLRRKLESSPEAPRRIITVHRAGYRFDP